MTTRIRTSAGAVWVAAVLVLGCGGAAQKREQAGRPAAATTKPSAAPVDVYPGQGAAIFDKWYAALDIDFMPDDPATPGVADGRGGPNGDGTLNADNGQPLLNDAGHDYRLKNLFGWDLRGTEGIYGPDYHAKDFALSMDLLDAAWSRDQLIALLTGGGEGIPAYGQVLDAEQIDAVVAFVLDVREGRLPRPDEIFELSKDAPKGYRLQPGGNAARGSAIIARQCARCHGDDGTTLLIDGEYTLGSHTRQKAYEDWLKVIGGQPGTAMGGQLPADLPPAEHSRFILDVFAALCDRQAFPPVAGGTDVSDGDGRCHAYLN